MNITENELLDALRDALTGSTERPEGYFTTGELVEIMGKKLAVVRRVLAMLHVKGEIECVQVVRPAIDGRLAKSPAYRLRPRQDSAA